jgi:hypothetical protein
MVALSQKTITELQNSSLLAWNSFKYPPLLHFVTVLAESNLSKRNHQSSELKGSSKTNLGAANNIDSPGSSGVVGRIPNTEKGGTYEQENVACDVNSPVSIGVEQLEDNSDRTSSRDDGDCASTAKLKVLSGDRDNDPKIGARRRGSYNPL